MVFKGRTVTILILVFGLAGFTTPVRAQEAGQPDTRRSDHVDVYHGVEVADPYRWLEGDVRSSKEVAEWVRRQNEVTFSYLESVPGRAGI